MLYYIDITGLRGSNYLDRASLKGNHYEASRSILEPSILSYSVCPHCSTTVPVSNTGNKVNCKFCHKTFQKKGN